MRLTWAGLLLFLWLSLMLLNGCVGSQQRSPEIRYYTLEYAPRLWNNRQPLPVVIRVQRFAVAPFYDSDRILYQEQTYRRDAYHYHRWRVTPGLLVTHLLVRDMRQSGLFKAVIADSQRLNATYTIEGGLDEFYEKDESDGWKAVLAMTVALVKANEPDRDSAVLFQENYAVSEPCEQRNPQAVARAMSAAMDKLSQQIISDVYEAINTSIEGKID